MSRARWQVAVRHHSLEPNGRRIPNVRRAELDLADLPAFVGASADEVIYLMAMPIAGLFDQMEKKP